jgi:hypothetical protein
VPGPLRISAKTLGAVAQPDFCPRCFWIGLQLKKLPFQIFPGIFSSIDSYSKHVVHEWLNAGGGPPQWLAALGDVVGFKDPPHFSKFNIDVPEFDITLTGVPDGILVRRDGSHVIVDYKTARYTKAQDALLPMYETQLNGYAAIGEQRGFSPVTTLALIYFEPVSEPADAAQPSSRRDDGFALGFKAQIHDVPLAPGRLPPLLARAREIYDHTSAPVGREGCKDCAAVAALRAITGG